MPVQVTRKTPGVYVEEVAAFPPSVVGVDTAVPAFVGYTEKAEIDGKPAFLRPVKIRSMVEFESIFGGRHVQKFDIEETQGTGGEAPEHFDVSVVDTSKSPPEPHYYKLTAKGPRYILHDSLTLFYANGGGTCWVVSVGPYSDAVAPAALNDGLVIIGDQVGPTMLVVPEAVLLAKDEDYEKVAKAMLEQAGKLQDRVAILDVFVADPDPGLDKTVVDFRKSVGTENLSYGIAYFPPLRTTLLTTADVDFSCIDESKHDLLQQALRWQSDSRYKKRTDPGAGAAIQLEETDRSKAVEALIVEIDATKKPAEVRSLDKDLEAALPLLTEIEKVIVSKSSTLPPSPAMAGVMTYVDSTRGVWNAPANIALQGVLGPAVRINDEQQGDLNLPVDGKAIDAIREFVGRGTIVWGSRTLDGNSPDYRYVQVRRTLIFLEQSIKKALEQFVFAPNDGKTWTTVTAMISTFLQGVWNQGGLMGATPAEAFDVQCGLGSTMTSQDILDGYLIAQVTLQLIRPAEFIVLTFTQKMGE